ncbi:MAG: AraC family transcriptional regulator [Spirochaetales bacterium]|nr:AraC family transcriptional regulator [Spirochaetales bacterium]
MGNTEVSDILNKSRASLDHISTSGEDFTLAYWSNDKDIVHYPGADHHTLSVYKYGYSQVVRTDVKRRGVENSFCLMPAGVSSSWQLEGPISFFHIYFKEKGLRETAEKVFDRGGETWSVPDLTYEIDRELILLSQWLLHTSLDSLRENPLLTEQNIYSLMVYLTGKLFRSSSSFPAKGGLSTRNCRIIREYIHENLDSRLQLNGLSQLAGLSEFHFMRMFKQSFGLTPHEYISRVRVDRAKDLMAGFVPLSQIALETGFSSQAHFTRVFKKYTGRTPGLYAKSLK